MLDRKKGRDKYGYDCEHFDIAGSVSCINESSETEKNSKLL